MEQGDGMPRSEEKGTPMTSLEAKPAARTESLLCKDLASGEIVVFDKLRNSAHCLNPAAAAIWRACDGNRTVPELASVVAATTGTTVNEPVVRASLGELRSLHLLSELTVDIAPVEDFTRRQAMVRAGAAAAKAAVLVPLIATVLAPKSSAAASCQQPGSPCTVGSQCCSGNCVGSTCA